MVLELKNIQENKNALFDRNEIRADVELDITPSREEALKALCAKFSCTNEVVSIIRIDSNFGTKVFTIVADIYNSKEAKDAVAIKRKKESESEKKVEEEKKAAASKNVPSEEVKEGKEVAKPAEPVVDNTQKDTEEATKVPEESPGQGEVSASDQVGLKEDVPSDQVGPEEETKEGKEKSEEKPAEEVKEVSSEENKEGKEE